MKDCWLHLDGDYVNMDLATFVQKTAMGYSIHFLEGPRVAVIGDTGCEMLKLWLDDHTKEEPCST